MKAPVDKFIGDAIMGTWNAPVPCDKPCVKACNAIAQIFVALNEINQEFEETMGVKMKIRVGVDHGDVLAGNVGCENRLNYTLVGSTVNLAARLEQLNKEFRSSVLVTDRVRYLSSVNTEEGPFFYRSLGFVNVRGFANKIRVHEFLGHSTLVQSSPEIADPQGRLSTD